VKIRFTVIVHLKALDPIIGCYSVVPDEGVKFMSHMQVATPTHHVFSSSLSCHKSRQNIGLYFYQMKLFLFLLLATACNAATTTAEPSSPTAKSETSEEIAWQRLVDHHDQAAETDARWRTIVSDMCLSQLDTNDRLTQETRRLRTETLRLRHDLDTLREEMIHLRETEKSCSKEAKNIVLGSEELEKGNEFAVFVKSEPIIEIDNDGNFTFGTPPERPSSAPLKEI
jgi:hypothetical protein